MFVDPVGTGFSRPSRPDYGDEFYGTVGDVSSVTEFVRSWRVEHAAEHAPLYLAGESWGAGRAASVAWQLQHRGIEVSGLALISGGWGLDVGNYLPAELKAALAVTDMAAAAAYHGRSTPKRNESPAAFRKRAGDWARQVYAPALARLGSLGEEERDRIAEELSRWTGIPEAGIDRQTLTLSPRQFRTGLLSDHGQTAYIFDLRLTSAPPEPDPTVLLRYWREELGYRTDLAYIGLEPLETGFLPDGSLHPP